MLVRIRESLRSTSDGSGDTVGVVSRGIWRIPHLASFINAHIRYIRFPEHSSTAVSAVVCWGRRPTATRAIEFAERVKGCRITYLEDGFIRSIGLGVDGYAPLSLVVDAKGIYYDATRGSTLEELIAGADLSQSLQEDAERALKAVRALKISKYNHAAAFHFPKTKKRRVLVVDQTAGDMSVVYGGADEETFERMLASAELDHPYAEIWVKTHPDVLRGKKKGYLGVLQYGSKLRILAEDCCPYTLLEQVDHVYVVTSQMGFEALILGRPVTVFGLPWYAGWGLTDDRHPEVRQLTVRRGVARTVPQLFAAAYLMYARYIKPATGTQGTIFDVLDWVARNKSINDANRCTLLCVGMSLWKRAIVEPFLTTPSSRVRFVQRLTDSDLARLKDDTRIVVWGSREHTVAQAAAAHGIPIMRVEDGFIRSSGLGSDLHGPLSLVVDDQGIYYDPFSRSRLERLLEVVNLSEDQRTRARLLRRLIVEKKITKYNVGGIFELDPRSAGRKVILVPGQVEDDASIISGSPIVRRNADLLARVRAAAPDAWILYKPHPDVVAGNRRGGDASFATDLADQIVINASISGCIAAADEVHTMTSLAGFEALLLGKPVHCYGGPFYSGWGLTVDHFELAHRQRRLTLDELVYVSLCEYPRYRLPGVQGFCSVEDVVEYLAEDSRERQEQLGSGWITKQWRKGRQLWRVLSSCC
ncbi:capsular polysaccharide biosynthesis protein [Cupriavidus cauae]|uniref:Capsular polysaccharide biosynthesis protein n=1 Tax=Cupriavidus cauae TaxID=2608999 RepID=A0A5M8BK27_9BURK|nr:capsular polysaccharide biosynthesis protein [Cupriavidus cauae]KAA6133414.1 capsular polysaccharide biosynthesis protein [Cupriavidus cauae]